MPQPRDPSADAHRTRLEARRAALRVRPNPAPRLTYRITLEAGLDAIPGRRVRLTVDYVPDRGVLDGAAFAAYARLLGASAWAGPEDLGVAVLDDINNEVVPRWVRVSVATDSQGGRTLPKHAVLLEDWQPTWNAEAATPTRAPARPDRQTAGRG